MICRTCASLVKFAMQILSGFQVGNQKQKQFCDICLLEGISRPSVVVLDQLP